MGSGTWSPSTYASTTAHKVSSGTTFGYSSSTRSTARSSWKAHESLDPKKRAGVGSPLNGEVVREARDNDEHPNSVPIAVFFDETGSMGHIPTVVIEKLGGLFNLLVDKEYVVDPQVLIGAYGDVHTDQVPIQIGQFESDNRVDDALDNIFVEGNGGGNGFESQSLAWYYMAHHTATDSFEKRNKKGYLFLIADEITHDLTQGQVKEVFGVAEPLGGLTLDALATSLKEKWDVFILLIDNFSAKIQGSHAFYSKFFGSDHILVVEDPDSIAETIGLAVGTLEGSIDLDEGIDDLVSNGSNEIAIRSATRAVGTLRNLANAPVATTTGNLNLAGSGANRL